MRRITLFALGFALLLSGTNLFAQTNSGVKKALQAKEHTAWQAWKSHHTKPFAKMLPKDSIYIAGGRVMKGKRKILTDLASPACEVKSFSLSGFSYIGLKHHTVMVTYTSTQDVTCLGHKQAGKVIVSALWQKRGGKWVTPFHQASPTSGK